MTFQPLDFTNYLGIFGIFFLLFPFAIAFSIVVAVMPTSRKKRIATYSSFLLITALLIITGMTNINIGNDNKEKATTNLAQKYEVKDVNWKSVDTTADPLGTVKEGKVLLTANNGEKYVFQYEINPETSEPKLVDMPIQGGNTVDKEKSAETLLKK